MRWLARLSIRNSVLVHMLIVGLILMGVHSFSRLPRELMSEIAFNWVFLNVQLPGASANEIEQLIGVPVERVAEDVSGISSVSSRSKEGYVFFSFKFEQIPDQEFQTAYQDLKEQVGAVTLPDDVKEPIWVNFTSQDFKPMVQVVLHGDLSPQERLDLSRELEDEIKAIDGIGKIEVGGVRDREVRVDVDPVALEGYGLSLPQVAAALQKANQNTPGGILNVGANEVLLRTLGQFDSVEALERVVVGSGPNGTAIRISDLAQVHDTFEELRIRSRFNGEPAATLSVSKQAGANSIELIEKIRTITERRSDQLEPRARVTVSGDTSKPIGNLLQDLQTNALLGMVGVLAVLWLVLGVRNALITALGVPLAFLATFIFMDYAGASLNGNSLFGLVLVLGIIVDDAIVLVENCARHRSMGKNPMDAVVDGVSEVSVPVLAAILTTIAAFLPLMLMPGIMGKFMRIIPVVVSMSLIASLAEALISLPCHIHQWGEHRPEALAQREKSFSRFVEAYLRLLDFLISQPIPRLSEASASERRWIRSSGWLLLGLPMVALGAGLGIVAAISSSSEGGQSTGVLVLAAVSGAVIVLAGIALTNRTVGKDLVGDNGLLAANALGLVVTLLLLFATIPALLVPLFGPVAGGIALALPLLAGLVGVGVLLARGMVAEALRRLASRLRHVRFAVFGAVYLGMIPLAIAIAASVDMDLFGGDEIPQISVRARMPEGTRLSETETVVRELEAWALKVLPEDEVESITAHSGLLITQKEWYIKSNVGGLIIDLKQAAERDRSLKEIVASLRPSMELIPGPSSLEVEATKGGPPAGGDIELKVQGPNLDRLVSLSEWVGEEVGAISGVHGVRSDWVVGKPELRVHVDRESAALHGVSVADVGLALRAAFDGVEATRFHDNDEDIPVIVGYSEPYRDDLDAVTQSRILGQSGLIPFSYVARTSSGKGTDAIRRYQGERTITITGNVDRTKTTPVAATQAVQKRLKNFSERFPGYRIDYSGEFEEFQKSLQALGFLGAFGMLLVYMILGAQFRSFVQPLVLIGFTFPGALLGAAAALLLTNTPLSILTLYGVVALLGIVVNDSLVLVSFINGERRSGDGNDIRSAILNAGRVRLRPIVLTTVTTVFGLLPMATGIGGKSVVWGPLATTIVCGLLIATTTTLFVIPPVYRCFADLTGLLDELRGLSVRSRAEMPVGAEAVLSDR